MNKTKRLEPALQFEQIYKEHHDPEFRYLNRLKKNREKRIEETKQNLGIE